MEYLALLIVGIFYSLACYVTYWDEAKDKWWYMPLGLLLGAAINYVWFYVCRALPEKERIYMFNLMWDAVMAIVYYGMPVLFFGVRMDRGWWIGMGLIVAGMTYLRIRTA